MLVNVGAVLALFASAATANHNGAMPRHFEARQTKGSSECATIFEPIITSLPKAPPEFISFWVTNNPATKNCIAPLPSSLTSIFSSVISGYQSWYLSNTAAFSSIASKCPQYSFGSFGGGGAKRLAEGTTSLPATPTFSLPPELASWTNFDFATGLPAQWASYAQLYTALPGCSTTSGWVGNSTVTPTPTNMPSTTLNVSSSHPVVTVNAGSRETGFMPVVLAVAIAGGAIAAM